MSSAGRIIAVSSYQIRLVLQKRTSAERKTDSSRWTITIYGQHFYRLNHQKGNVCCLVDSSSRKAHKKEMFVPMNLVRSKISISTFDPNQLNFEDERRATRNVFSSTSIAVAERSWDCQSTLLTFTHTKRFDKSNERSIVQWNLLEKSLVPLNQPKKISHEKQSRLNEARIFTPLITCPAPSVKTNGSFRSWLESNFFPLDLRVP